MIRRLAMVGLSTLLFSSLTASAGPLPVLDGRDSGGLLDVGRAEMHGDDIGVWRVTTLKGWTARRIRDQGYFVLELDTIDGPEVDYYVLVRSNGHRLLASLWEERTFGRDRRIAAIDVFKPANSIVRLEVPLLRLDFEGETYRWKVVSLMTGPRCRRVCLDRVPDSGAIMEPAPGTAPSPPASVPPPTPSESPAPSPSESPTPTPTETPAS